MIKRLNPYTVFKEIKTFVLDVDGVFTDNSLLSFPGNDLIRAMNAKDGLALKIAIQNKFHICIITGGQSIGVMDRLHELGVLHIYSGVKDKKAILHQHFQKFNLSLDQALYIGDDEPDIQVMLEVRLACCPKDAIPAVRDISQYISPKNGGQGCVRDIIEKTLRSQEKWM